MLSHSAQALSPTPDGLYPGANVAEGGSGALHDVTTGTNNTAIGAEALSSVTQGIQNTAVGAQALKNGADPFYETAVGFQALAFSSGSFNTAIGWRAMFKNTSGGSNTAIGDSALYRNIDGPNNVAIGTAALFDNVNGFNNTAVGVNALAGSTGGRNIGLGHSAGGRQNTHLLAARQLLETQRHLVILHLGCPQPPRVGHCRRRRSRRSPRSPSVDTQNRPLIRHLKTGHFLMAVDRDVDRDAGLVVQRRHGNALDRGLSAAGRLTRSLRRARDRRPPRTGKTQLNQ